MKLIKSFLFAAFLMIILPYAAEAKRKTSNKAKLDLLPDERLCMRKRCGKRPKGSMCQVDVDQNGKRRASCVCPTSCDMTNTSPVCSVFGRQYESKCMLHREACKKKKNIKIANEGPCIASQTKCKADELLQFPFRLMNWFIHLKEKDEFGTVDPRTSVSTIGREEMQEVAEWKFNNLDRNEDGKLNNRELKRFRYALMPLEHCAKNFFKKCDTNKNKKLTIEEWRSCLVDDGWNWMQRRKGSEDTNAAARHSANEAIVQ